MDCSVANKLLNMDNVINAMHLNKTVYTINKVLTDSAKECYPDQKEGKKEPKLKVMNPDIQNAIQQKKKAFYLGKQNGRSYNPSNVFLLEKKLKTIELRRQIQIAKRRQIEKTAVINARQSDNALFHRLIRKQRGQCLKFIGELYVGQHLYSGDDIITGWFEHFEDLSTKQDSDNFDFEFLKQVENEVSIIYVICLDSRTEPSPVTDDKVKKAASSLNRGKAPDAYGVTAEHIYYGGQKVMNCVKMLINNILFNKEVPSSLELGILNPIFKNKGTSKESLGA